MMTVIPLLVIAVGLILLQTSVYCQSSGCPGCSSTTVCIDSQCLPRCTSSKPSGECEQCQESLYGKQCENECPKNCSDYRCHLETNSHVVCTDGCVAGWRGGKCTVPCPNNCRHCDRYGDDCISCKQGYYGVDCDKVCPENCDGSCNVFTGQCSECKPDYRGTRCTVKCPVHCGSDCSLSLCQCVHGYTGAGCDEMCPPNCVDDCDRHTGQCSKCKPSYWGGHCDETCPEKCSTCDKRHQFCTDCFAPDQCVSTLKSKWDMPVSFAVGTVLLCLFVVLLFVVIVLYHIKRRKKRRRKLSEMIQMNELKHNRRQAARSRDCYSQWDTDNPVYEPFRNTGGAPLPRIKLCPELKSKQSKHHMKQEFLILPGPEVQSSHCGRLPENISKNRYRDILPFDSSRVCLAVEDEGDCDFINASYIDGYKQKTQYIAAQGPTEDALDDFWRLIWQCEIVSIVMLTNLTEVGEERCTMYWPQCGIDYKTYRNISVQCVEERVFEHHTVRSLAVWKSNQWTRRIKQFHYTAWPAQDVPDMASFINFYKVVGNASAEDDGTTLVHCSAGVGRTGTYLALVHLIEQAQFESRACVFSCVSDLRFQRMKLVHTEEQYIFLYHIVTAALQTKGILPGNTVPVWLQCKVCWETDKRHPVVNGVRIVYNPLDKDTSSRDSLLQT